MAVNALDLNQEIARLNQEVDTARTDRFDRMWDILTKALRSGIPVRIVCQDQVETRVWDMIAQSKTLPGDPCLVRTVQPADEVHRSHLRLYLSDLVVPHLNSYQ